MSTPELGVRHIEILAVGENLMGRMSWARVFAKARLRVLLAGKMLMSFEPSLQRSRFRVSFSQSGEDMIVWFLLKQLGLESPCYLDVGAHHPEWMSNTALFSLLGCWGMNIEPDPRLIERFRRRRPRDINLNIGLGDVSGLMKYFRMSDPALNTFSEEEAFRLRDVEGIFISEELKVPVRRVSDVLAEHRFLPDFVSIDAEGRDLEVLTTYDFGAHRPAVFCVETVSFSLSGEGRKIEGIFQLMESHGYRAYADTYINTIFVDSARFRSRVP